jgi:hypothetical protein
MAASVVNRAPPHEISPAGESRSGKRPSGSVTGWPRLSLTEPAVMAHSVGELPATYLDAARYRWLRPASVLGMVDARAIMPAHSNAGTAMA